MPTAPHFNDPEYWHQRAEEARVLAKQMKDEKAKQTMLGRGGLRKVCGQSG